MLENPIRATEEKITTNGLKNSNAKVIPAGTVLVSIFATVGRATVLGIDAATNQAIVAVMPKAGVELDRGFLLHALTASTALLVKEARGVAQVNINSSILKQLRLPLPPLPEQRRIADILDRADALKRKRQQALQLADDFLGSIFDYHFGSPEKCSGYTSLGSLIDPERPLTYGILMPGPDVPDGIPYIRVAEMKDGTVDLSDVKRTTRKIHLEYKRSILAEGDILISIRGHVGRVVVIPAELDGANITQDAARIACKDSMYREFVAGALLSAGAQRWMQKRVRGAAVKGLNLGDLRQLPIPVPSDGSLRAYTQAVRAMRTVRNRLTSVTVEAEALSGSLANGLLSSGGEK